MPPIRRVPTPVLGSAQAGPDSATVGGGPSNETKTVPSGANLKGFGVAVRPWRDGCSASTEHGIESRLTDTNQTPLLVDNAKGNPPATIGNREDLVGANKPHSGEATKPAIAG